MPGFVTCGPNEALVVSGCCHRRPLMVPGGRVFVWPFVQKVQRITLNTMTLTIESPRVYTQQGVPISVTGIAQVKIQGQNSDMLRAACEQFLGKNEDEIMNVARETLEGHQRAIMASMTVEEIYKNRKKFSKKVFEVASSDLVDMGFTVVSYTIKDISDEEGYLKALGLARTAEVKRDARIGEAEAKRDALIKEALAEEERMAARYLNDAEIAKAQRDFELKKAAYDVEVFTKKAESDLAYNLQAAKTRQRIKEEQMQVKVIERTQEIQVQEQEIARKEKELEATVRRPAEAEKFKLEKLAEANRNKIIMEAEAEAESLRLRGEAEAFAVEAKAKAEAEQMAKKANAFKEYDAAAKVDMVLETLPKVAAEIAAPLAQCNKVTMISQGNSEVGAGKLTGEVLDIITKVHLTVSQLTGAGSFNSPVNIHGIKKPEASKDRGKDRHSTANARDNSRDHQTASNRYSRSQSQDESPYAKQYHSYRTSERRERRGDDAMSTSSTKSHDDRSVKSSRASETKVSERRNSAQMNSLQKYNDVHDKDLRQSTRKYGRITERRNSSNAERNKIVSAKSDDLLNLEDLEDGEMGYSKGLPSSTDANVSELSGDLRPDSPNDSVSSSSSKLQETLKSMANKGSARKGMMRGAAASEQHNRQTKILNAYRNLQSTNANTSSSSPMIVSISGKGSELMSKSPKKSITTKAIKSFAMPLPVQTQTQSVTVTCPIEAQITSQDSQESSNTSLHGSNSGTSPSKKRKRYYKGGTYGLYLSKKKKKIKDKKLSDDVEGSQQGEESSQSFPLSDSDGEGDSGDSSAGSVRDNDENYEMKVNENDICEEIQLEEVQLIEVQEMDDCVVIQSITEEIGLISEETHEIVPQETAQENEELINEEPNEEPHQILPQESEENIVDGVKLPEESISPNKLKNNKTDESQKSSSSIIESVKNRPRKCKKMDDESEVTFSSPSSSTHSKSKADDKLQSPPNLVQHNDEQLPHVSQYQFPNNTAKVTTNNTNATENIERKTLLRMSTAGSIESGETHGTYLGAEQKKFVVINDTRNVSPVSCLCTAKPMINSTEFVKGKPLFCQAIDCFDEKLIGCCNHARLTSLFRAAKRVPFRILCEVHLARLRRHHCCPGCGLFCTQGEFLECFCVKKQVHLFHKKCQTERLNDLKRQQCLHCGNVSIAQSVRLVMNGPIDNNVYYLQQISVMKTPRAKMTIAKRKGKGQDQHTPEDYEDPGIEYTIPETKKILSLAGLPLGPQRKQLEDLLASISSEKQSLSIRFTNKNFYAVAKTGDIEKVLSLLAQGFDPNYTFEENDNETPLHAAASAGHLIVVHLLIQSGASPNVLNKHMITPLIQAIENRNNTVVKYLINSGASLDIRGEDGMTALHFSAKFGNIESVHYILNSGRINVNLQDDGGWTALVWGTEHKHYNIVKLLVNKGADPNIEDDEENIGLHWAAFSGESNIALLFVELGCDISRANTHGDTPLHIAARRDNYDCVVLLLSRGSDITKLNRNNETPFECCPKNSQSAMALKINQELKRMTVKRSISSEKHLHRDLSKGKEYYQIQVVNGVDDEPYPIDFMYVTENCETSPINIDRTISSLQSCQCDDDCTSQRCVCAEISFRCWYDKEGKLLPEFNLMDAPMIFECNRACNCWKSCNNRVVQYGVRTRLQVFRTKGKGWGVRTLRDIPRGTFVCEYIGEIITDSEADRREDDSYLFDLDNKDGETYCLDARFYANICRFINHMCSPNLIPVKVFVDHQDLSFPRIALFSNRDIKAYEELGFDYGEKFWVIKYKWFMCSCGSTNCKYNKDTIQNTLENYYRRIRDEQTKDDESTHIDDS